MSEQTQAIECDLAQTQAEAPQAVIEQEQPKRRSFGRLLLNGLKFIFIDGMSGMTMGLFATLIIGTIIETIGKYVPGTVGVWLVGIGTFAKLMMGIGIGVGVALRLKKPPLAAISAGVAGCLGAYAMPLLAGEGITIAKVGEPLGAFVASFAAVMVGSLVAGKTKVDILVTPLTTILTGAAVALALAYPIDYMMKGLQYVIKASMEQQPYIMSVLVAAVMGCVLTLPISSAALGIILQLDGLVAGAAAVGCCTHMVGYAVMSFRENKWGGLLAQGLGTSMLQMPNLIKRPILWLPPVIVSAVLGPVSLSLGMLCNTVGSGMGTSGLVGCIGTFTAMTEAGMAIPETLIKIVCIQILAPAVLCLILSELMRRLRFRGRPLLAKGDLALQV